MVTYMDIYEDYFYSSPPKYQLMNFIEFGIRKHPQRPKFLSINNSILFNEFKLV